MDHDDSAGAAAGAAGAAAPPPLDEYDLTDSEFEDDHRGRKRFLSDGSDDTFVLSGSGESDTDDDVYLHVDPEELPGAMVDKPKSSKSRSKKPMSPGKFLVKRPKVPNRALQKWERRAHAEKAKTQAALDAAKSAVAGVRPWIHRLYDSIDLLHALKHGLDDLCSGSTPLSPARRIPGVVVRSDLKPVHSLNYSYDEATAHDVTDRIKIVDDVAKDVHDTRKNLESLIGSLKATHRNLGSVINRYCATVLVPAVKRFRSWDDHVHKTLGDLRATNAMFDMHTSPLLMLPPEVLRIVLNWSGPNSSVPKTCKKLYEMYRSMVRDGVLSSGDNPTHIMHITSLPLRPALPAGVSPRPANCIAYEEVGGVKYFVLQGGSIQFSDAPGELHHTKVMMPEPLVADVMFAAAGIVFIIRYRYVFLKFAHILATKGNPDMELLGISYMLTQSHVKAMLSGDKNDLFFIEHNNVLVRYTIATGAVTRYDARARIASFAVNTSNTKVFIVLSNEVMIPGPNGNISNGYCHLVDISADGNMTLTDRHVCSYPNRPLDVVYPGSKRSSDLGFLLLVRSYDITARVSNFSLVDGKFVFKTIMCESDFDESGKKRVYTCSGKYGTHNAHLSHNAFHTYSESGTFTKVGSRLFMVFSNQEYVELTQDTALKYSAPK